MSHQHVLFSTPSFPHILYYALSAADQQPSKESKQLQNNKRAILIPFCL